LFHDKLKMLREIKNLSQKDLAADLGLSRHTIGKYERNERLPDLNTFVMIADYFNVSADYLLDRPYAESPDIIPPIVRQITLLDKDLRKCATLPESIIAYKDRKTEIDRLLMDLLGYHILDK
jgi:transcriptional regulator with XRE-family HTH domain